MAELSKVSEVLSNLRNELALAREDELMMADEVLSGYVQDHNDKDAWKENERAVNRLARAWDKMIARLEKWEAEAEAIEASCENFYGK